MMILLIGLFTLGLYLNIFWYEYRVKKNHKEKDLMEAYVQKEFKKRYKR